MIDSRNASIPTLLLHFAVFWLFVGFCIELTNLQKKFQKSIDIRTEGKLTKETIRRIGVENKLTEFEKQKQNYFNELSWKRFGEDMLIEYQTEQWVNEQMEDKKNQELLDRIDYKLREEY